MSDPLTRLRRFLRELKRRNVYKVAVAYLAAAFIVVQAARLLVPALLLPEWIYRAVVLAALLGFPLALVVAWAFEMTPEGVRRTETPEGEGSGGAAYQWIGLAVVVLLAGGVWYATTGNGGEPAAENAATTDTTTARTASTARDSAGPPRIAVLPFENIARDTGDAFFALGMHEEVLNQLSKVSGLAVLSRTTMMEMADAGMTASEIGRELDADAILEGTVRRAGDRVRITTQLIETPADEHLWSNSYERALSVEEIFDIQADIAEQIAGSLETQLAGGERQRIESVPTSDLAAYEAFLRGRNHFSRWLGRWEPTLLDKAVVNLREAVRRDSTFAPAHALLARAFLGRRLAAAPEEGPRWMDSASAALERARRINPDLASVHVAQASLYEQQDSLAAETEAYRRALDLQPSNGFAKTELSENLARQGEYVEAVRVAREAVRLDPRWPWVLQEMGDQLRYVGLYDASEAWYRHILKIDPGYFAAYNGLADTQSEGGQPERVLETWQRFLEQREGPPHPDALDDAAEAALFAGRPKLAKSYLERLPDARRQHVPEGSPTRRDQSPALDIFNRRVLGLAEVRLGNGERGRRLLQQVADSVRSYIADREDPPGALLFLAETEAALGQSDRALENLERWWDTEPNWRPGTFSSPFFDDLRSDPRFQKIVRDVEARQEARRAKLREEVRQLGIDLYPPGTEPDTTR